MHAFVALAAILLLLDSLKLKKSELSNQKKESQIVQLKIWSYSSKYNLLSKLNVILIYLAMKKEHKIFGAGTDQELSATKQASNTQAHHIFSSDEMP